MRVCVRVCVCVCESVCVYDRGTEGGGDSNRENVPEKEQRQKQRQTRLIFELYCELVQVNDRPQSRWAGAPSGLEGGVPLSQRLEVP